MSTGQPDTRVDRDGRSRLHHAAFADDAGGVAQLIGEGLDPSLHDRIGMTPLHLAAQEHSVDAARSLLDGGAQIDAANEHGNTPLFTAVFNSRGRGEMIALLRERGADPGRENSHGQTPAGLARLIGNYDVSQHFAGVDD